MILSCTTLKFQSLIIMQLHGFFFKVLFFFKIKYNNKSPRFLKVVILSQFVVLFIN